MPLSQKIVFGGRLDSILPSLHEIKKFILTQRKTLHWEYFALDFQFGSAICLNRQLRMIPLAWFGLFLV